MYKKERNKRNGNKYTISSPQALTNREKKKNREGKIDREIRAGLAVLKEPLAQFAQESEDILATQETPPLSYFTTLVRNTMVNQQKVTRREIFSFSVIAVSFLTLIGYLLHSGYLLPVLFFFTAATLLLPTAVLFTAED